MTEPTQYPLNATVSSLKSEDSTEQLICKTPLDKKDKQSVSSKSAEAGSVGVKRRNLVVFLGLGQVVLGALLVGAGALAVVKGAALARVGAGLWAGCVAVVAGVVGVLAGINDCYGLNGNSSGSGLLTAFLALSLLCLACGNSAAVLAATGLQRAASHATTPPTSFQDEMEAWTPVLTNIAVLIIAAVHCLVSVVTIYYLSKRVCPCFRPRQPFDHNQFDPGCKPAFTVVDEKGRKEEVNKEREKGHELCKELEVKLQGEMMKKKTDTPEFGSANSKEKLVSHWLGRQGAPAPAPAPAPPGRGRRARGVRKRPPQLVLLPAHPASTVTGPRAGERDGAAALRNAAAAAGALRARADLLPRARHSNTPPAVAARRPREAARARPRLAAHPLARAHPPQATRRASVRRRAEADLYGPGQGLRRTVHRSVRREPDGSGAPLSQQRQRIRVGRLHRTEAGRGTIWGAVTRSKREISKPKSLY